MNEEFAKRQAQVLEILDKMASYTKKQKELLVFIGGSAVQITLKKPKRLSIDLDIYYNGDADILSSNALSDYKIEKRVSRDNNIFQFYEATKGNTLVKIDITKFELTKKTKPYKTQKTNAGTKKFKVNIATPDYLLASKLSSLAINTVGRNPNRPDYQMNFLKDVYDSNCLMKEFCNTNKTWEFFTEIGQIQNQIRKTSFSTEKITESAIQALLNSTKESHNKITKGTLQSFSQYTLAGSINTPNYWEMAYKIAAYLTCFKNCGAKEAPKTIALLEKHVSSNYANHEYAKKCEEELIKKGIDKAHAHELRILAPKALLYLQKTVERNLN